MAGFERALRRATDLDGELVTPGAWADVMARSNLALRGADPRIRHAAAIGTLVTPDPDAGLVSRLGLNSPTGGLVGAVEAGELRRVALLVTRAAARGAEEGPDRLLLAGVERRFLAPASAGGVEAGLLEWSHAVASAAPGLSGASALLIARTQHSLLTMSSELMDRVEVLDGVGHARLLEAVDASREQWRAAHETWRELVPRTPEPMGPLQRGLVAVQMSIQGASDEDRLRGLLATGMGGNLIAATAVTPPGQRPDSGLVATAALLEARSDLSRAVEARTPPHETEVFTVQTPAPIPEPEPLTSQPGPELVEMPRGRVWDVDRVPLDDIARLAELAGERDAGLAAVQAGASGSDEVVEAGERARATLAAAGLPIVGFWSRRVFPQQRDEFVSAASLKVMELADTWDPGRSRWSTYVYSRMGFFVKEFRKQQARVREMPSDTFHAVAGAEDRKVAGSTPTRPEDQAILNEEHARVRRLVEGLPDRLRPVAEQRLGLDGEKPRLLREVGEDLGLSTSGTQDRERRAVDELRSGYARDDTPTGPVSLGQLADALSREAKQRTKGFGDEPAPGHRLDQRGPSR